MKSGLLFLLMSFFIIIVASADQSESKQSNEITSTQLIENNKDCVIPIFKSTLETNYTKIILCEIFQQANQIGLHLNQIANNQAFQHRFVFLETKFHRLKQIKKLRYSYPFSKNDDDYLS